VIASLNDPRARSTLRELAQHASPEGLVSLSAERVRALLGLGSRQAWLRLREALRGLGALTYAQGGGSESSALTLTAAGLEAARADSQPDSPADRSRTAPTRAKPQNRNEEKASPPPLPQPQRAESRTGRTDRWTTLDRLVAAVEALLARVGELLVLVAPLKTFNGAPQVAIAPPAPRETRPPEVQRDVKPANVIPKARRVQKWEPEGDEVFALVLEMRSRCPARIGQKHNDRDVRFYDRELVARALNHAFLAARSGDAENEAAVFWSALKKATTGEGFDFDADASLPRERVEEIAKERQARAVEKVELGARDAPKESVAKPAVLAASWNVSPKDYERAGAT
jgi:hypothetical protein